jgi:tRNA-specific adenosine deaminase 1
MTQRRNIPCPIRIRCKSSGSSDKWPAAHPKGEKLSEIKRAMQGKDPHAKPPPNKKNVPEPTRHQLYVVALHQAIPFVGFGIMDNAILLLAGEAIDVYLGVTLGISTMCAAAIGNIISDLCGVVFGTMIEDALLRWSKKIERITGGRVRLPPMPKLSYDQRNLRSVRWSSQLGCAAGLTVGCVIGMFPLLFFPDVKDKEKDDGASAAKQQLINEHQHEQLKEEINQWKTKHAEVLERLRVMEREKNDGLWDRGY